MSDAFWFQTFWGGYYYCLWGHPYIWHPQKVANKWPTRFHHLQKWTTDLLFKIMESANTWQILRTPILTHVLRRHHKCMFLSGFLKFGLSYVWMQMKFWISWKFSQAIFYQATKEIKQAYIFSYISYFLNKFLVSLCQ